LKVRIIIQVHTPVWLLIVHVMGSKLCLEHHDFFPEPLHCKDNALSVITELLNFLSIITNLYVSRQHPFPPHFICLKASNTL
jgi:hypothetical protein